MSGMPVIQPIIEAQTDLTDWQRQVLMGCVGRGGRLRSSKPKDGTAAYVWRMIAFMVSPNGQHQCMPMTADFDLPQEYWGTGNHEKRRAFVKTELDPLVDRVVDGVSPRQRHGVNRWAQALGYA